MIYLLAFSASFPFRTVAARGIAEYRMIYLFAICSVISSLARAAAHGRSEYRLIRLLGELNGFNSESGRRWSLPNIARFISWANKRGSPAVPRKRGAMQEYRVVYLLDGRGLRKVAAANFP
ncbi:hypothetical protein [Pseudomonas sp. UMAB-40]|uniref:hypothetical protein n=1 Tax=Pseudomonas sp. UMAB-40 TaxID=1365407 RepID=UPI001C594C38|nr:hypothetical protein [Pseudomonas sp. UMAB-40]